MRIDLVMCALQHDRWRQVWSRRALDHQLGKTIISIVYRWPDGSRFVYLIVILNLLYLSIYIFFKYFFYFWKKSKISGPGAMVFGVLFRLFFSSKCYCWKVSKCIGICSLPLIGIPIGGNPEILMPSVITPIKSKKGVEGRKERKRKRKKKKKREKRQQTDFLTNILQFQRTVCKIK